MKIKITKVMWEQQKGKEEIPLIWFYYYYRLNYKGPTPVSQEVFERNFTIYCNNIIHTLALTHPEINVYEVLIWTIFNYFDTKFK